jgi:hypothetical protein
MSCIQLSTQHTAAVAHGLAFILNGAGGMDQLSCFAITSQVCRAFKSCMYPHDSLFDDRKIYAVLYKLNETAYEDRYQVPSDELDGVPAMPQNFPHLLHLLPWDSKHFTIDRDFYAFTKLLDSFIYQCSEDVNRGSEVLAALSAISRALYAFIVHNSADYAAAEWAI